MTTRKRPGPTAYNVPCTELSHFLDIQACNVLTNWGLSINFDLSPFRDFLLKLVPNTEKQVKLLKKLDLDSYGDVLKHSAGVANSLDLLVPPDKLDLIADVAKQLNVTLHVIADDYGRYLDERVEKVKLMSSKDRKIKESSSLFRYHSYEQIQSIYRNLASKYPELVTLEHLGKSFEGRNMELVKISMDHGARNPVIFIDAGIHAREWVAPATALYFIHELVEKKNSADLIGVDYYILPSVNPDGYEYSRNTKRMWRKTRSKRPESKCYGVDGNRNYGYMWSEINAKTDPCNFGSYIGPHAFSEKETIIVRKVMMNYRDRMKMYITLHCYGQLILYPWGWSVDLNPDNHANVHSLAERAEKAMVEAGAPPFKKMCAAGLYVTTGTSTDYAYSIGIPYSYAIELTEGYEFVYPEEKLSSTIPPFYKGLQVFAKQVRSEFSLKKLSRPMNDTKAKDCKLG